MCRLGELDEVLGEAALHVLTCVVCVEPLLGELANGFEQPEALPCALHEALLDERLQRVEVGGANCLGRLVGAAAGEHGQPGEQVLFTRREQVVGPGDACAERVLAGVTAAPRFEQIEALREPPEHLRRREHTRARRGELDRERQVVEASAQLRDVLTRLDASAGTEQRRGLRLGEHGHAVGDLALDEKQLAARSQDLERGCGFEQPRHHRRGRKQMLEVVQHEEGRAFPQFVGELACVADRERLCDCGFDQRCVDQRRQCDEEMLPK